MSSDGNRVIIGAPLPPPDIYVEGLAYIFERGDGDWGEHFKLERDVGDDNIGITFGHAVAIEGDIALVGFPNWNGSCGLVYVFHRSNTTNSWTKSYTIKAPNSTKASHFGVSLDISARTAIIGEHGRDNYRGKAYIFGLEDNSSTLLGQLVDDEGKENNYFGLAVSISDMTAIVGSPSADHLGVTNVGAAFIFRENSGTWDNGTKVIADDGTTGDFFGYSVCTRGNLAIFGAPNHMVNTGAAYLFRDDKIDGWNQVQKLFARDGIENDSFGRSVAIVESHAIVGADRYNSSRGSVYLFSRQVYEDVGNEEWLQEKMFSPATFSNTYFGLAVSASNHSFIVGAPGDTVAYIGENQTVSGKVNISFHFPCIHPNEH